MIFDFHNCIFIHAFNLRSLEHLKDYDVFDNIKETLLYDELLYLPEDIGDAEDIDLPFTDEYAGLLEPDHDSDDDQSLSADEYHYMSGMPNHHSNPP